MSTYDPETIREPRCPKCGGHMWNNIATKRNPRQPDFKCKDKQCDGVIWPPRNGTPYAEPKPKPLTTQGKEPYSAGPHIPAIDGPVAPVSAPTPRFDVHRLDTLFGLYGACLNHAIAVEIPKLIKADIGADPETAHSIATTLFIAAQG